MSNNSKNQRNADGRRTRRLASAGLVLCLVAILAAAGTYGLSKKSAGSGQTTADGTERAADDLTAEATDGEGDEGASGTTEETASDEIQNEADASGTASGDSNGEDASDKTDAETDETSGGASSDTAGADDESTGSAASQQTSVSPQGELSLAWPVDGSVLMSYSMDRTVFFKTLNQYKYNPAMLIGGSVGDEVTASACGTVSSVEVSAQTGTTVTMNIGSGYEIVYGQLKEVAVEEGDYLDTGARIGYLSEPTKYYTEEGCNLYYQVLENGNPVNPMDYLDSDQ